MVLVRNISNNTNIDTEIKITEDNAYNGSINVSNLCKLDSLDCSLNQLVGLDVSANTALTYLDCSENCPIQLWSNEQIIS